MKNKVKAHYISEQDRKSELKPRVRFPEFTESWRIELLAPFLEEYDEKIPSTTSLPIFSSTRSGLKPQSEYYSGDELANSGEYRVVPVNHFVYRHMSDDGTFKFNINKTGSRIAVSKEYPVFTTKELDSEFLLHMLNETRNAESLARQHKKGGTRTRLYFSALRSWKSLLPSYPEQRKIGECLASIDELIAAEGRKLSALKAHKKALLQQLFPAEGETIPRLRFPKFKVAGDWISEPLGKLASYENGKAYEQHISEQGQYIVVNASFISTEGRKQKYTNATFCIAEQGDVLMVLSDLPKGKALAKCFLVEMNDRYAVNQRVCKLKPHRTDSRFLFYVLNRARFLLAFDDGLNQTHLAKDSVLACPISHPQERREQIEVSGCLSSIDELMTAQSQKIDTLRAHKKGLTQQLFPVLDEVQA